ncbi:MAG: DoxX family protein [Candidatus Marinimicrobia bacterium]|nr:DoxX family protein [Candidatus Neomarinimicrobiota bacterium]|tara:strand:- start:590 stop:1036 length:447 start_codon:yes stop_codon:yes gene_type:complete
MKNLITHKNTLLLFRFILGAVFIYASIDKIQDPKTFSDLIDNYHITPLLLHNLFALIIPWVELLIGISLITGIYLEASIQITIFLLIWFIFILSQAVYRGIDTHCGCFKAGENIENTDFKGLLLKRIFEDVIFLGMALILKFKHKINR